MCVWFSVEAQRVRQRWSEKFVARQVGFSREHQSKSSRIWQWSETTVTGRQCDSDGELTSRKLGRLDSASSQSKPWWGQDNPRKSAIVNTEQLNTRILSKLGLWIQAKFLLAYNTLQAALLSSHGCMDMSMPLEQTASAQARTQCIVFQLVQDCNLNVKAPPRLSTPLSPKDLVS